MNKPNFKECKTCGGFAKCVLEFPNMQPPMDLHHCPLVQEMIDFYESERIREEEFEERRRREWEEQYRLYYE